MGLDGAEIVMEIEDQFEIQLPDDEESRFKTVGDLHQIVIAKLIEKGQQPDHDEVFRKITGIISRVLNIAPERIKKSSRHVEDLGID